MANKKEKSEAGGHPIARKHVFYNNYDYGEGPIEPSETSPGSGFFANIHNVKSVSEFLAKKRKSSKAALDQSEYYLALASMEELKSK